MNDLLHFSSRRLGRIHSKKQESRPDHKPRGLWVSVGEAWAEWCLAESYCTSQLTVLNHVTLAGDAKILRLKTGYDLDRFTGEYGAPMYAGGEPYIEWSKVAEKYDGIIIAPYIWSRRHDLSWYYSWDVASGCVWNADAIASIEGIELESQVDTVNGC